MRPIYLFHAFLCLLFHASAFQTTACQKQGFCLFLNLQGNRLFFDKQIRLNRTAAVRHVSSTPPRGGGGDKSEIFKFNDEQRAVFASLASTLQLMGKLGLFVASARLVMATLQILAKKKTGPLLQILPSAILPNIFDISLAKVHLKCARVFSDMLSGEEGNDDNISSLLKALGIFEKHLKSNILPKIFKTAMTLVVVYMFVRKHTQHIVY